MKTLPLKQAMEQATRGPFFYEPGSVSVFDGQGADRHKIFDTNWVTVDVDKAKANAALLAHCFNHFAEVVGALQECAVALERGRELAGLHFVETPLMKKLHSVLTAANEVKII